MEDTTTSPEVFEPFVIIKNMEYLKKSRLLGAITISLLVLSSVAYAQQVDFEFDVRKLLNSNRISVITDPAIGKRCFRMIEKRQRKIKMKQKVRELMERNKYLQKIAPKNKEIFRERLKISMRNLLNESSLVEMKITQLEEDIIRKGCPGIQLQDNP